MSNAIEQYAPKLVAFNGKAARSTDEEITIALGPIFVAFPKMSADFTDETLGLWKVMLRDLEPKALAAAVFAALAVCKFPPTIADIREHVPSPQAPGPASPVDPAKLKAIPTEMFRLDPDEDRRQRMERLRQTKGWGKYYA